MTKKQVEDGILASGAALKKLSDYAEKQTVAWFVDYADTLFDPNAPRVPRTMKQRWAYWWEWRVLERFRDARWWLAGRIEALAERVRGRH